MNIIHSNFHKLPSKIYKLKLSAGEFVIISYLLYLSNNRLTHPSIVTISNNTNLSKSTVIRSIKSLVTKGYLEYNKGFLKGKLKMCNQYRVRIEKIDPMCVIKRYEQIEIEELDSMQCNEMIKESLEKYTE